MTLSIKNLLKDKSWGILTWICEFRPGNKTVYVVFDEESDFRSQDVIFGSRPSFLEKTYPIKICFQLFYVFVVFPWFCYLTGEFPISPFWGHPGCEVPQVWKLREMCRKTTAAILRQSDFVVPCQDEETKKLLTASSAFFFCVFAGLSDITVK